jgi:hypothetical protein
MSEKAGIDMSNDQYLFVFARLMKEEQGGAVE